MLTIKKRYPYNKLYIAGSLAFIAGYGGIMVLANYVPQRYSSENLAAVTSQAQPAEPAATETAPSTDESTPTSNPRVTVPVVNGSTSSTEPTAPVTEETPAATTPEEPVVTDPEEPVPEVPAEPTPEEDPEPTVPTPSEILEGLGDLLTP